VPERLQRSTPVSRRFLWTVGLLVVLTQLAVGVVNLIETFQIVFRDAPYSVVPPMLRKEAKFIQERIPPGAALVYVMRSPEPWQSRLWHRLLYPSPVLFFVSESAEMSPAFPNLKRQHDIRFALSVGEPPLDPGFRWHVVFPAREGYPETWFGELSP